MKNLKILFSLLICLLAGRSGYCQYYYYDNGYYDNDIVYEFGVGVGGMNCITDVGGANVDKTYYLNEIKLKNTKLSYSIFGNVMYQNFIGARLEATWGSVQSSDKDIVNGKSENIKSKRVRNLSFKSNISEISLLAEFHPLMLLNYEESPPLVSPYFVAGIGRFGFNPQADYRGHTIDLRPLHTEGEGFAEYKDVKEYKTHEMNVPIGFGFRYEVSALCNLRLEFLHRITFTDYLDDASSPGYVDPSVFPKHLNPVMAEYARNLFNRSLNGKTPARRANPNNNDSYMTVSFKVAIVLGRESRK